MSADIQWRCPNCQLPLNEHEKYWRCANGHTFDIAKEGYVNLLLSSQKRSKDPGDNKAMINARRTFLEKGHYNPLVDTVVNAMLKHLLDTTPERPRLLDLGCGEGFYLQQISERLQHAEMSYQGIDISKSGIQKAAKRKLVAQFAVASTYNIPCLDNYNDIVLQIFAPSDEHEVWRALKPKGIWLRVQPGANHLIEIKEMVYDAPALHAESKDTYALFDDIHQEKVSYQFSLTNEEERLALLQMTPFYWSISEEKKRTLVKRLSTVTADFNLTVLQK
ncbi:MAG: putative RNA methyltransferase [Pseudomonadota bacterium]